MAIIRRLCLFLIGGTGYVGMELLWRGRSHYSMFLAGGVCFLLLGRLQARFPKWHPLVKGLAGALLITAVELAAGLIFNRGYQVWDYRRMPLQFLGQVCLPFSLLWIPISLFAMGLYRQTVRILKW